MTQNYFTMVGKVGSDPTLKQVAEDKVVVNFRLCSSRRAFDENSQSWSEKDQVWVTAEAWGQMAEHIFSSIERGMNIIAVGILRTEDYKDELGTTRTHVRFRVLHLGPDTRFYAVTAHAPARVLGGDIPQGYVEYMPKQKKSTEELEEQLLEDEILEEVKGR